MTRFGIVRYWRLCMRSGQGGASRRHGLHPLDVSLGLLAHRFVSSMLALAVRLASRMSFAEAREVPSWFCPAVPSVEVIEAATLGYGRHAPEWFELAPAPSDDGRVLVVLIDSEGARTATEAELAKRRGKRKQQRPHKNGSARRLSQRHRRRGRSRGRAAGAPAPGRAVRRLDAASEGAALWGELDRARRASCDPPSPWTRNGDRSTNSLST